MMKLNKPIRGRPKKGDETKENKPNKQTKKQSIIEKELGGNVKLSTVDNIIVSFN